MIRVFIGAMVGVLALVAGPTAAFSQQPGDQVVFAVPLGASVTIPTGDDPGDKVLFTGGPTELVSAGTCSAAMAVAQNAVFVDPRQPGIRSSRRIEVVVLSQFDPVTPGTRLIDLASAGTTCTIGGVSYDRYRGTVD